MNMKIKKPTFTKLNIKKILKDVGKFILNIFTMVTIIGGGILAFASYINPTPYIAEYFPNLQYGIYNLKTLYVDVQWWQSLQYYNYGISSGLIILGLAIHIRSIGKLIRAIKSSPRAIINFPLNAYKKLKATRDWVFDKVVYLNSESKKWRTAFNIAKSPYTLLRALGFSPQMALGLITIGGSVGGGVVVNETVLKDRTFSDLDFSELEHPYNFDEIRNSWQGILEVTNTLQPGTYAGTVGTNITNVIRYPFVNWTGTYVMNSNGIMLPNLESSFRPFINLKYILIQFKGLCK